MMASTQRAEHIAVLVRRRDYLRHRIEKKALRESSAPMDKAELAAMEWALSELTNVPTPAPAFPRAIQPAMARSIG
jgi:hypothetical protein